MRMRDGNGERVGGVGLQRALEAKQDTHHVLHLGFVATAATDHGLFDFGCRVFVHFDASTRHRADRGPLACPSFSAESGFRAMNTRSIPHSAG